MLSGREMRGIISDIWIYMYKELKRTMMYVIAERFLDDTQ